MKDLLIKYNVPVPRYTSYPTVPCWKGNLTDESWMKDIVTSFVRNNRKGISIYIHLPYCESLCTYCACNTRITVNHSVEKPYVEALLKEWELYLALFPERPVVKEIHLGGGTPTFFSPQNLKQLISGILRTVCVHEDHDLSFEGHPANTTAEHLQTLFGLGFRRVSFGVQDFDPRVGEAINRLQSYGQVCEVIENARRIGYRSVNVDLVYGLPFQTLLSVSSTLKKVIGLKPDRVAYYSYAHVPWMRPGQRKYSEKDLPNEELKMALCQLGREEFLKAGYSDIGMDHFALEDDELCRSFNSGKLHRNFMGYTARHTDLLIGLGASAISDSSLSLAQNEKKVEDYIRLVSEGKLPIAKGHTLDAADQRIKKIILELMCKGRSQAGLTSAEEARLIELEKDGLVERQEGFLIVTKIGRLFLRNICRAFDARYWEGVPGVPAFSSSV